MINQAFVVATWLIGVLGVGGAIAAVVAIVFLGPAAVIAIVEPIFARFIACRACIVVVVFVLATTGAYWVGHHQAAQECREADLAAELRNREIDLTIASTARSDETERANKIEANASEQHAKDLQDIADLKKRPPTCIFDDTDAGSVPDDKPGPSGAQPPAGASKAGPRVPGAVPHKHLLLPMVWNSWLPWGRREGDAAPHK
jgi:hypothetical protein